MAEKKKILDDENVQDSNENEEGTVENGKKEEKKSTGEMLKELTTGSLALIQPFTARGETVTELGYDFCSLTTEELFDALDSAPVNNMFTISNKQAIVLFAATAGKCAPMRDENGMKFRLYDAKDVKTRLGAADAIKAVQLAKLFYHASSRADASNTSK